MEKDFKVRFGTVWDSNVEERGHPPTRLKAGIMIAARGQMGALRLFLAISVLLYHGNSFLGYSGTGGDVSVECFFIISGFLISLILHEKYPGPQSVIPFYVSRGLRIYPLYWVVAAVAVCIAALRPDAGIIAAWRELDPHYLASAAVMWSNISLLFSDLLNFFGIHSGRLSFEAFSSDPDASSSRLLILRQSWTLGTELSFYLIAPFLVRARVSALLTVLLISFELRYLTGLTGRVTDPWSYRFFPFELSLFVIGALSYRLYRSPWYQATTRSKAPWLCGLLGLAMVCYPMYGGGAVSLFFFSWQKLFLYILLMLVMPALFRLSKRNQADRFMADLSYPLYLIHLIALAAVGLAIGGAAKVALSCVLSLGLSAFLVVKIERPIDIYRHRLASRLSKESAADLARVRVDDTPS